MNCKHSIASLLCFHTISFSEDDPISDADAVSDTSTNTTQMKEVECGNMVSDLLLVDGYGYLIMDVLCLWIAPMIVCN
jgi:hypothetical protein